MTIIESLKSFSLIFSEKEMLYFWFIIAAYGFNLSFIFGTFPSKIGNTKWSALSLTIFGVVHIIMSITGGRISHLFYGNILITISTIGVILGVIFTSFANHSVYWLYVIAGGCFGVMEGGILIQLFIIFGNEFSNKLNEVNSAFRFISGGAVAILFFLSTSLNYSIIAFIVLFFQINGLLSLYFRTWNHYINLKKDETLNEITQKLTSNVENNDIETN
jgi:MFS family permease